METFLTLVLGAAFLGVTGIIVVRLLDMGIHGKWHERHVHRKCGYHSDTIYDLNPCRGCGEYVSRHDIDRRVARLRFFGFEWKHPSEDEKAPRE